MYFLLSALERIVYSKFIFLNLINEPSVNAALLCLNAVNALFEAVLELANF